MLHDSIVLMPDMDWILKSENKNIFIVVVNMLNVQTIILHIRWHSKVQGRHVILYDYYLWHV